MKKYRFIASVLDCVKWEPKGINAIARELKLKKTDIKVVEAILSNNREFISVTAPREKGDICAYYIRWGWGSDNENIDAFLMKLFICDTSNKEYKIDAAITMMSGMIESYIKKFGMFGDHVVQERALDKLRSKMKRFKGKGLELPISHWGVHFAQTSHLNLIFK